MALTSYFFPVHNDIYLYLPTWAPAQSTLLHTHTPTGGTDGPQKYTVSLFHTMYYSNDTMHCNVCFSICCYYLSVVYFWDRQIGMITVEKNMCMWVNVCLCVLLKNFSNFRHRHDVGFRTNHAYTVESAYKGNQSDVGFLIGPYCRYLLSAKIKITLQIPLENVLIGINIKYMALIVSLLNFYEIWL